MEKKTHIEKVMFKYLQLNIKQFFWINEKSKYSKYEYVV